MSIGVSLTTNCSSRSAYAKSTDRYAGCYNMYARTVITQQGIAERLLRDKIKTYGRQSVLIEAIAAGISPTTIQKVMLCTDTELFTAIEAYALQS